MIFNQIKGTILIFMILDCSTWCSIGTAIRGASVMSFSVLCLFSIFYYLFSICYIILILLQ